MPDALTAFLVPDAADSNKAVMIKTYGFVPNPNMGLAPLMTNGEPVPQEALLVSTVNGVVTVTVSIVQMILIYGLTLASQLWKG